MGTLVKTCLAVFLLVIGFLVCWTFAGQLLVFVVVESERDRLLGSVTVLGIVAVVMCIGMSYAIRHFISLTRRRV